MASFDRSFSASSPVLVMAPQSAPQFPHGGPASYHDQPSALSTSPVTSVSDSRQDVSTSPSRPTAGRKRSRDEASSNLNDDEIQLNPIETIPESEDDYIYGPGMILIKKSSAGYVADASSQSGTWVEEKQAQEEAKKAADLLAQQQQQLRDRPTLRSHKSQRLEAASTPSASQEFLSGRSSPVKESPGPSVDDFTMHLGVGWSRIASDEHIQAAARGWARYIENHYGLDNVTIHLESKGLQSYLVESSEGYFLFAENLRQGRFVSRDAGCAMENLRCVPPMFDGPDMLVASDTPISTSANTPPDHFSQTRFDMEMDMS